MNVPSTEQFDSIVDVPPSYSSLTPSDSGGIDRLHVIPNYPPPSYDMAVKGKSGRVLSHVSLQDRADRMRLVELHASGQLDRLLVPTSAYDRAISSQLPGAIFEDSQQSLHPSCKHQMLCLCIVLMFLVGSFALLAHKMKLRSEEMAKEAMSGCKPGLCQNGGSCVNVALDAADNRTYRCLCGTAFSGAHCNVLADPCKANSWHCFYGGKCISGSDGSYKCNCTIPYSGAHCEIDNNPCRSQPCHNGGKCMYSQRQPSVPGDMACLCLPAFTGRWCEHARRVTPHL